MSATEPAECPDDDHDWSYHSDTEGDGVYTMQYFWRECDVCGKQESVDGCDLPCDDDWYDERMP